MKTNKMLSLFAILPIFLSACTPMIVNEAPTNLSPTNFPTDTNSINEITEQEEDHNEEQAVPTAEPEVLPLLELEIPEPLNPHLLIDNNDGSYSVYLDPKGDFDRNHPDMLSYVWHLNTNVEGIKLINIEFDLDETVEPNHPDFFGYDRGYFIGLHHLATVPDQIGDPLRYPELGVDTQNEVIQNENHITIMIPYEHLRYGLPDIVLQFLPGTTFSDLSIFITPAETGDFMPDMLDELTKEDNETAAMDLNANYLFKGLSPISMDDLSIAPWLSPTVWNASVTNGSANMYLPAYYEELGEYSNEIIGDYGIVPEGIFSMLVSLTDKENNQSGDWLCAFILNHMVNPDTGLIYGVWDNEQGKLVATDRTATNTLQIATIMLEYHQYKSINTIFDLFNGVVEHELIEINGKLYYVPGGVVNDNNDGSRTIELTLNDLAISGHLIHWFGMITYSQDGNGLNDPYAAEKIMDAYANSLDLLLTGQEQTPTKLPGKTLTVIFHNDGSCEYQWEGDFNIKGAFFSTMSVYYGRNYDQAMRGFGFIQGERFGERIEQSVSASGNGDEDLAAEKLAEAIKIASNWRNSTRILNTFYKMYYNIYNFSLTQSKETIFAGAYNIWDGSMVELESVEGAPNYWSGFYTRFGGAGACVNWVFMMSFFHNDEFLDETIKLVVASTRIFDLYLIQGSYDANDIPLDVFNQNKFSIIGDDGGYFDRLFLGHPWPAENGGAPAFDDLETFDWREQSIEEFIDRKLREAGLYN